MQLNREKSSGGRRRWLLPVATLLACAAPRATPASELPDEPPASCEEIDQGLATDGAFAHFILDGVKQAREDSASLDTEEACRLLRNRSAYASGLIGMLSYCDNQQVLAVGTPNNVIYRRVGDAVRRIGNGLEDLLREKRC